MTDLHPSGPPDETGSGRVPHDEHLISAARARAVQATATAILAALAIVATLWFTKVIAAPVLAALIFGIVLSPVSDFWDRLGFRASLGAFLTVLSVMLGIAFLAIALEPYITMAINRAPLIWQELRGTVDTLRGMFVGAERMAQDVADAVAPDGGAAVVAVVPAAENGAMPTVSDALYLAPQVMSAFLIFIGALYFFVLTRHQTYEWAAARIGLLEPDDFLRAERRVAKYLLTITAINAAFGLIVAAAMHGIGMSTPIFWGLAAFMLNFVLYLGPIFLAAVLLVAGHVAFDGAMSFAPAALYLTMNAAEGQFITPALVGQRMAVSPLAVFLSLVFWMWLWGPIGAIVAIPVLIWALSIRQSELYRQAHEDGEAPASPAPEVGMVGPASVGSALARPSHRDGTQAASTGAEARVVEPRGIEPLTSSLRTTRSPN